MEMPPPPPPPPSRVRLPCLAFNSDKYFDAPILFSLSERKSVPASDELTGKTAWPTPHGWFLVRHAPATFLWNPTNGDKIQLPPLPEDVTEACTCVLSDKPAAGGGCVVLMIDMTGPPVLWYCHVGGGRGGAGSWAMHEYDIGTVILYPDETMHEKLVITPVASCRGKVYFSTGFFDKLGVIEFGGPTTPPAFSSIAMRDVPGCYGVANSAMVFMVESKERIYMVNLLFEGSLYIQSGDLSRQEWCRVHDLGGQAFLVSSCNFGASRPAHECGLEEDCVYATFPWHKAMMIYNIKEGRMKVESLEEAPESEATPFWMLPTDPSI